MKHRTFLTFFALIMLLSLLGTQMSMAQVIIAPPTPTPVPPLDSDGDGLPDTLDQCPTVAGPTANMGCPVQNPPGQPPNNPPAENPPGQPPVNEPPVVVVPITPEVTTPPPFVPPALPTDGCTVTPATNSRVNVRSAADLNAAIIGSLLPGVVYAADGTVTNGTDVWFRLANYQGSTGTPGYSSRTVLLYTNCPPLPGDAVGLDVAADGLVGNPPDQPVLCHLSVGYDAATWGGTSTVYGAFWFAAEAGTPITAGTPVWGVVFLDEFLTLPDSFLQFHNADTAVAAASSQSAVDAAKNAGIGATANMGWPTANGGVFNGAQTLYRLSDDDDSGACGPIVGLDGLVSAGTTPPGEDPCLVRTLDHAVTVLAWARVDGVSPSQGGGTVSDDVIVDGNIITGENPAMNCTPEPLRLASEPAASAGEQHTFNFTEIKIEAYPDRVDLDMRGTEVRGLRGGENGGVVVEYCISVELYEVGVFNEVCYQIEIPANCVLSASEAGVYTVVCDEHSVVQLNPALDGLPALDITVLPHDQASMASDYLLTLDGIKGESRD